ncbi:MAG: hypothetical protein ISS93_03590 [Candidatus Aenigmarchaeota archaeon]|nr:hypothetical protein [Candidatus Aenigmarchaeota archaeon]
MKLQIFFLAAVVLFAVTPLVFAQQSTCVYFFYGEGCPHCGKVIPFIVQLNSEHQDIDIHIFEIYSNRSNALLLNELFTEYNIPDAKRGIPAVFVGESFISGDNPILEGFEAELQKNQGASCPLSTSGEIGTISLATVIGAALVDSINPCAIAVLLILLGALLASGDRRKALKAGLAFSVAIYIVYFLFGLGLFSALQITGLSYWFYKVVGLFAIAVGLINIKDYFWYGGGGFVMEVPRGWRPRMKKMLNSVTTPAGAFIVAFAVSLFELPCTGGPYIFILGLLAERTTQLAAIPILLLYNVFFILPLIVITLLLYRGFTDVEKAGEWKERNIRRLHLIAGIVMLALGLAVALGIV